MTFPNDPDYPSFVEKTENETPGKHSAVFRPGELIPLKGLWFEVERCEGRKLVLEVVGATKTNKRRKRALDGA